MASDRKLIVGLNPKPLHIRSELPGLILRCASERKIMSIFKI